MVLPRRRARTVVGRGCQRLLVTAADQTSDPKNGQDLQRALSFPPNSLPRTRQCEWPRVYTEAARIQVSAHTINRTFNY